MVVYILLSIGITIYVMILVIYYTLLSRKRRIIKSEVLEAYLSFQNRLPPELHKYFKMITKTKELKVFGSREEVYNMKFKILYCYKTSILLQVVETSNMLPSFIFHLEVPMENNQMFVEYSVTVKVRMSLKYKNNVIDAKCLYSFRIKDIEASLVPIGVESLASDYKNWASSWLKNTEILIKDLKEISSKEKIYLKKYGG